MEFIHKIQANFTTQHDKKSLDSFCIVIDHHASCLLHSLFIYLFSFLSPALPFLRWLNSGHVVSKQDQIISKFARSCQLQLNTKTKTASFFSDGVHAVSGNILILWHNKWWTNKLRVLLITIFRCIFLAQRH